MLTGERKKMCKNQEGARTVTFEHMTIWGVLGMSMHIFIYLQNFKKEMDLF